MPIISVLSPGAPTAQSTTVSSTIVAPNQTSNFAWTGSGAAVAVASLPALTSPHTLTGINDGVYGNSSSYIPLSAPPAWIKIDLGTWRVFDLLTLGRDRTGSFDDRDPGQFRVYVSNTEAVYANGDATNDATEYTLVYDSLLNGYNGQVSGLQTVAASFAPVFARYVKIELYTAGGSFLTYPAIDEIQVRSSVGLSGADTFVVTSTTLLPGMILDGGSASDTLRIDGGGTIDLTGVTLNSIENLRLSNTAGTRVTASAAQLSALTGSVSALGAADTIEITSFSFLGTFATPATRASQFEMIADLFVGGVENVEWQEGGATNVATISGANIVVTSTDPAGDTGGLSWATSVFTFDGTGQRLSKVTTMDNGSVITRTFASDVLLSDATSGIAGPQDTITITYDSAGRRDSVTTTYDDGTSSYEQFDADGRVDSRTATAADGFAVTTYFNDSNQRIEIVSDDTVSNRYPWATSSLTLDPVTGQVTRKVTTMENAVVITETYSGGLLTERTTEDVDNTESYDTITQIYSAGVFQYQSAIYDNGTGLIIGSDAANRIPDNYLINDTIIGKGGADVFIFDVDMGNDRILDFQDGLDLLDFTLMGIDTQAELLTAGATIAQTNAGVVISFGGSNSVTLKNIALGNFSDADFVPVV